MRTLLIFIGIFTLLGTTSCGTYHYSGDRTGTNWSATEIAQAEREVNKVIDQIKPVFKRQTKDYLDCYLYKVMRNYQSFEAANNDQEGCTVLAEQCAAAIQL